MAQLSIGILGLPNVGKSTLFQALTDVSVAAENYPFCTIDPNVGVVPVPDARLDRLEAIVQPRAKIPPVVEFVDIAGLVKGASRGEGLGNRFLANVREAHALAHVVRAFTDESVVRTEGVADPLDGVDVIETELALSDLEIVTKRLDAATRRARTGDRDAAGEVTVLERLEAVLADGTPARSVDLSAEDRKRVKSLALLTLKPLMYVLNVDDPTRPSDPDVQQLREALSARDPAARVLTVSARLEAELSQLPAEDRGEYLEALGLKERGLDRLIRAGYEILGLETFFTVGEREVRGWTFPIGATAPEAAGQVHTDFERAFIRAETIHFDRFVELGSLKAAREQGQIRFEGKEYRVKDGDILLFRTSA